MNYSYIKRIEEELKKLEKNYALGIIDEHELVQQKEQILHENGAKKIDLESLERLKKKGFFTKNEYDKIKQRIDNYDYSVKEAGLSFVSEKDFYIKRLKVLYEMGYIAKNELTQGLEDIENKYK